jgi:uncharacterized protein involved in exopolysaccharide biosynthesis
MDTHNNDSQQENRHRALTRTGEYPVASSGYEYHYPDEEELHIRDYLQIVLRRKWIVITFLVAVITTVTIGTFMMKPSYKATATLKIDKDNSQVILFKESYAIEEVDEKYYQTQYKMLKSKNLAKRVIRKMKLASNPEFSNNNRSGQAAAEKSSFLKQNKFLDEKNFDSSLVNKLISHLLN